MPVTDCQQNSTLEEFTSLLPCLRQMSAKTVVFETAARQPEVVRNGVSKVVREISVS
jgi:hypothetical protein